MKLVFKLVVVFAIGFMAISTYAKIINSSAAKAKLDVMLIQNDPADAKFPIGAKIYKEKCIICHMANGKGIPGAFPPLKNSDYLFADKVRAVRQTLNGSQIEMVVNGMTYVAPMTPQVDTKEDAVAVINYVLNAWGNNGGTVTLEDVKNVKINPR